MHDWALSLEIVFWEVTGILLRSCSSLRRLRAPGHGACSQEPRLKRSAQAPAKKRKARASCAALASPSLCAGRTLWSLCVLPGNLKSAAEVDREQLDELIESEVGEAARDVLPSYAC